MDRLKLPRLQEIVSEYEKVAVGFSGGVDSAFLLAVAAKTLGRQNVFAITVKSELFSSREEKDAIEICRHLGIEQNVISMSWEEIERFSHNPPDRCYICKKTVFTKIIERADALGADVVFDGTNRDDKDDDRPGERAIRELGVRSPLYEAGFSKREIRERSKQMGLFTWQKPPFACLASRIPYERPITQQKLSSIDRAERGLFDMGFTQVRVRHHDDVARIEVSAQEIVRFFDADVRKRADELVKEAGFRYAALDLTGYRTGSLNIGTDAAKEGHGQDAGEDVRREENV